MESPATLEPTPRLTPPSPAGPRALLGGLPLAAVAPWAMLALLFAIYATLEPAVLDLDQLGTIAIGALVLVLVAIGQTIVVLTSGIDLSVGGVLSLGSALVATQMTDANVGVWVVLVLLAGALAGAANGLIITTVGMQPFIVTLATWSVLGGIALLVLPTEGGMVPVGLSNFIYGKALGIPNAILLLVALLLAWGWLKRTRLLRRVYAIGSDEDAAFLSGVPIARTKVAVYAISGLTAASAAVVLGAQTSSGDPNAGDPFILTSIAAVVIGGTSLWGGRGGAGGTVAGALILTIIANLVFSIGLPQFWTPLVQGVLMIVAVVVGAIATVRHRRRRGEA
jgi:ribose transport system permease protein